MKAAIEPQRSTAQHHASRAPRGAHITDRRRTPAILALFRRSSQLLACAKQLVHQGGDTHRNNAKISNSPSEP